VEVLVPAAVFAVSTGFTIFFLVHFEVDEKWIAWGLVALLGATAWAFRDSLKESGSDGED
jgi:hypothetical protein